jgi:hypothetical protein
MTTPVRQSSPPGAHAPGLPEARRPFTRGRQSLGALAWTEARHLARSPLLWAGLALALPLLYLELNSVWPARCGRLRRRRAAWPGSASEVGVWP